MSVGFMACSSSDNSDSEPAVLNVGSTQLNFSSDSETQAVSITSNLEWSILSSDTWVTVTPNMGSGNSSVIVQVKKNTNTSSRSAVITVNASDGSLTRSIAVNQEGLSDEVMVSPTSPTLSGESGSSTTVTITANSNWSISGCPDWLQLSATSGTGTTSVTLKAKSENFSDDTRSTELVVRTSSASTSITVSQEGVLPTGLKVSLSDLTVMSDGFAANLTFGSRTKGYREAFFTENAVKVLTERDIYNMLMEKDEYTGSADFTFSPIVDPNTTIIYCVAAYGNENNPDGTHKYGPMTMQKITTPRETVYADMPVYSISYTSSRWTAVTQKVGAYGTRCSKYYYYAAEGETATLAAFFYNSAPYAFFALNFFKPYIAQNPNEYAISGQSFYFGRSTDQFFFGTWGIDDNGNYSAELRAEYRDLSESSNKAVLCSNKVAVDSSKWNVRKRMPTKSEIEEIQKSIRIVRIK